mmetsp:Transcript_5099/g.10155  ORF Transcript_5099/g.10155 Transcript_5099/m.10155 type:complete len:128 (-) Transcript_5099:79-462(-)
MLLLPSTPPPSEKKDNKCKQTNRAGGFPPATDRQAGKKAIGHKCITHAKESFSLNELITGALISAVTPLQQLRLLARSLCHSKHAHPLNPPAEQERQGKTMTDRHNQWKKHTHPSASPPSPHTRHQC